jgi:hypothetical protein
MRRPLAKRPGLNRLMSTSVVRPSTIFSAMSSPVIRAQLEAMAAETGGDVRSLDTRHRPKHRLQVRRTVIDSRVAAPKPRRLLARETLAESADHPQLVGRIRCTVYFDISVLDSVERRASANQRELLTVGPIEYAPPTRSEMVGCGLPNDCERWTMAIVCRMGRSGRSKPSGASSSRGSTCLSGRYPRRPGGRPASHPPRRAHWRFARARPVRALSASLDQVKWQAARWPLAFGSSGGST